MNEHIIEGEQAYPIWRVEAKWEEDVDPNTSLTPEKDRNLFAGHPDGRWGNSSGHYVMYREEVTEEFVRMEAHKWWQGVEKFQARRPTGLKIESKFVCYEVWCGKWFNHYTFDIGQTDVEVETSFNRFVMRMEELNRRESKTENGYWSPAYVLMGAEDRWRWKGPCRCDDCKRLGLIHMDH